MVLGIVFLISSGVFAGWWFWPDAGDPRLRTFVSASPSVPIVFTSRTEPASFHAAAPQGEEFVFPGQRLWQSREGRLRLLTPRGEVHELTWGKPLPDGGTLIDVMSPTISVDASKIIFAGRRKGDHGHFRLYEIGTDGRGLRQLTGAADDPGCTALPPMRYAADGKTMLSEDERRRVDYDDVDPIYADASNDLIVFASSRTPDLGRGQARRSTTLWVMNLATGQKHPLTANRYNDRWPFLMTSNYIAFSLWSHNQEVISADERDIVPYEKGQPSASAPVDAWQGAFIQAGGGQFGSLIKPAVPVWRPRPLFNGRIVFMTTTHYVEHDKDLPTGLRAVSADPGLLANVPSARPAGQSLPAAKENRPMLIGPMSVDADGQGSVNSATPSPCPPHHVVLAAAPWKKAEEPAPGSFGIFLSDDGARGNADDSLTLLFDDPEFVDAEPVAVYPRASRLWPKKAPPPTENGPDQEMRVASGAAYRGPLGTLFNSGLYAFQHGDLPGQRTDTGEGPIFAQPPPDSLHSIRIYASRRDRFDDPVKPRIPGEWELLVDAPVTGTTFGTRVPAGVPTVLAGFDKAGRIVRWATPAKDSQGRQATFYAFAGDHYSAARPMGKHFCIGCHPGHSGFARADHHHAEKMR